MTRFDLSCRLRMLHNQLQAGEIDPQQHRFLRRAAALAYAEGRQLRRRARRAVQSALESGELTRPEWCEACDGPGPIEAHHKSYAEQDWLRVEWYCAKCHGAADRALATGQVARLPAGAA